MDIEAIIMKQTLLGQGRRAYVQNKRFSPPFDREFEKEILPMIKTHPGYFNVVYAADPTIASMASSDVAVAAEEFTEGVVKNVELTQTEDPAQSNKLFEIKRRGRRKLR